MSGVGPGDRVLEIGPGEGALTFPLLEAGAEVLAVEIDDKLVPGLKSRFGSHPSFDLLESDALEGKHALAPQLQEKLQAWGDYALVSNLPYAAGTPILMNLWQSSCSPVSGLVMVQKEVGERLAAREGSSAYGTLSVLMANVATVEVVAKVSPGCFNPPPKVDSCLVKLVRHDGVVPVEPLQELVREGFAQRRKKIGRLAKLGWNLEIAGIDPDLRPQDIPFVGWFALSGSREPPSATG